MTASDVQTEIWKPVPGAGYYEASDRGQVRSVDRTINGRKYPETVLKPRPDRDGYLVVNITYDSGERKHGVSVARLVLLAHVGEPDDPAMQACHGPGGQKDNRLANLRWDTDEANRADWRADNPPKPKPVRECARCGAGHAGNGRRCHGCVVELGQLGAQRLADGEDLETVAQVLDYPSAAGLFRLAVRYGGLRCAVTPRAPIVIAKPAPDTHSPSRLRRVTARWMAWLKDDDAE